MVVTQSNLGGSLRTAFEQILGSLLGAAYATAVALVIRPDDAASIVVALVHECVAAPWQLAAESAATTLGTISEVLAGKPLPEGFDTLTAEVRTYKAAIEDMRRSGITHSLSTSELGRLFGIGCALEQLRRDLDDLVEVAQGVSHLPRRFVAGQ